VARRLFLADAAHHGADLNRPHSQREIDPQAVKVGLGIIITIIVAPSLPPVDIPIFSANAVWVALQQVMIGVAVGFTMQLAFAAVRTAGELIGLQMGLSFATFVDPVVTSTCPCWRALSICWPCCCSCRSTVICG
jgi:flagellar biosynthesis protein FliR